MNTASNTQRNLEASAWLTLKDAYAQGFLRRQVDGYYARTTRDKIQGEKVQVKLATGDILAVA